MTLGEIFRSVEFPQKMAGSIDLVTPEGIVEGWCWNENLPGDRITVVIAVDGAETARVVASDFRGDLKEARIGDGCHAFRHVLPINVLNTKRSHRITIADAATGLMIGRPVEYQSRNAVAFDERIATLETHAALLEGRVQELLGSHIADVTAAELFSIVGSFFERLSNDISHGKPVKPDRQLGDSIRALAKTYPPLVLSPKQTPVISIFVEAAFPLGHLYACLDAIKRASFTVGTRVTVLDTGTFEEVALVPSIVRGVRYIRTGDDLVSEWIEAERDQDCPFLMFLSGQVVVDGTFLDSLMVWLTAHPRTGAMGGCEVDHEGKLIHGGLCLLDGTLGDCARSGHSDHRADMTLCHPVHALSHQAAIFRREAFKATGGLDLVFGNDIGSAVIDLCFRLRAAGWTVDIEPRAKVGLLAGHTQPWLSTASSTASLAGDLLYQRWLNPLNAQHPPLFVGVANIIGQTGELQDEIEAVRHLREAGYLVAYVSSELSLQDSDVKTLKNFGATIRSRMEDGGDDAPTLIFISLKGEIASTLPSKARKAQVVTGLAELKLFLQTNFTLTKAN